MKCPEGFCRDAEHCMQGGRCEDAVGELAPLVTQAMAPEERDRINSYIAAELLALARRCDARADTWGSTEKSYCRGQRAAYRRVVEDLRDRAMRISSSLPDDLVEIETRLNELRATP